MAMIDEVRRALDEQLTVEITTIGRRSGQPRRIETWRYLAAGRYWLTGSPGRRDWYANLVARPEFILHLSGHDVPARARIVTGHDERVRVFGAIVPGLAGAGSLESWIEGSPLAEIELARYVDPGG